MAVIAVQQFFETLSPASIARLPAVYTEQAAFKDPFNEVRGLPDIARVFSHMFVQVQGPRFVVREVLAAEARAFMTWDFLFRRHGQPAGTPEMRVHGASLLHFAADGRIASHHDYWDAASELYEKLPFIGPLMRFIRRRAAAVAAA